MRKTLKDIIHCADKRAKRRTSRLINLEKRKYLAAIDDNDLEKLRVDLGEVIRQYECQVQRLEVDVFDAKQNGRDVIEIYKHDLRMLQQELEQLKREKEQDLWDSNVVELHEYEKRELRSKYRKEYLSKLPEKEKESQKILSENILQLRAENKRLKKVIEQLMSEYGVKEVVV